MNKQYDFGEKKKVEPVKMESTVLSNNIEKKEYDFQLTEAWEQVGKLASKVAQGSYTGNMFRGMGAGAAVGSVGGIVNNTLKSDNDPTKRGIVGAAFKGATKGAVVGGVGGLAARGLTGTQLGREMVHKANLKGAAEVANRESASARQELANAMKRAGTNDINHAAVTAQRNDVINATNNARSAYARATNNAYNASSGKFTTNTAASALNPFGSARTVTTNANPMQVSLPEPNI